MNLETRNNDDATFDIRVTDYFEGGSDKRGEITALQSTKCGCGCPCNKACPACNCGCSCWGLKSSTDNKQTQNSGTVSSDIKLADSSSSSTSNVGNLVSQQSG